MSCGVSTRKSSLASNLRSDLSLKLLSLHINSIECSNLRSNHGNPGSLRILLREKKEQGSRQLVVGEAF